MKIDIGIVHFFVESQELSKQLLGTWHYISIKAEIDEECCRPFKECQTGIHDQQNYVFIYLTTIYHAEFWFGNFLDVGSMFVMSKDNILVQ
jgi:hypothetical protein